MFYSHAFLARKSPLGTVWIAAHLENRLRKSHVAVTDIQSSVDYIMFPEVPIALRLSGHLLLGVVRIYSKKVDYLYHDCNEFIAQIRTMFAPLKANILEDAHRATFQSVTLPDTFELDALELDDMINLPKEHDNHLKAHEEITLQDQVPVEGVAYVPIFLDEDSRDASSLSGGRPQVDAVPMEEDILPPFTMDIGMQINPELRESSDEVRDPGPSNHAEGQNPNKEHFADPSPELGIMRDAHHNFEPETVLEFGGFGDNVTFQDENLVVPIIRKEGSPIKNRLSVSAGEFYPSPLLQKPQTSSSFDPQIPNIEVSPAQSFPGLELQPSPVLEQKPKRRKRKLLFEDVIVLTNVEMQKQLNDTSKLVHKRRKLPCASLDVWRFQLRPQNERLFEAPLLSGLCDRLQATYVRSFPATYVDSVPCELPEIITKQPPAEQPGLCVDSVNPGLPEVMTEQSPAEQPRFDGSTVKNLEEVLDFADANSPVEQPRIDCRNNEDFLETRPSPFEREVATPIIPDKFGSVSLGEMTLESDMPWTLNTDIPESVGVQLETPLGCLEERLEFDTDLREIPTLLRSPVQDDMNFLEADSQPTINESDTMSARTRAVARYLKEHSPGDQMSASQMGNLSLNRILEGKKRKQCARMFFETLVLKSNNFIDVQQKEAYGDITISLTPALSKMPF